MEFGKILDQNSEDAVFKKLSGEIDLDKWNKMCSISMTRNTVTVDINQPVKLVEEYNLNIAKMMKFVDNYSFTVRIRNCNMHFVKTGEVSFSVNGQNRLMKMKFSVVPYYDY